MIDYLFNDIHPLLTLLVFIVSFALIPTTGVIGMTLTYDKRYMRLLYWIFYVMANVDFDLGAMIGTRESMAEQHHRSLEQLKNK